MDFLFVNDCSVISQPWAGRARARGGDTMFKFKTVLAAALLAAPALWAVTSIVLDPVTQREHASVADQIDTFHLMSTSPRLAAQSYDAY
jgi:hypothetical protein